MAQAVVSTVGGKLGDFLVQQAEFLYGVRGEVRWIEGELRQIQCFLEDADQKRKGNDQRVKNWVRDVRDVAYDAEDIIETFVLKIERRRRRRGFTDRVFRYTFIFGELIACYRIGSYVSDLKTRILDISDRRARYGIANIGEGGGAGISHADEIVQARRRILPHDDDSHVVGFEDDRKAIVGKLLDPTNTRRCVISIVGMGGQGKTTLAKKVYTSSEIKRNFEKHEWISVSQDYNVKQILKKIMKEVSGISKDELDRMEEDELKEKLHEFLIDKRYLVVMDDIWSTDVWEKIVPAFPDAKNGSRIIFTSRSIDVAKSADPDTPPYELRFLNEQESWELFLKKVFPNQDVRTSCPENLVKLGKELVKRCGGLPLALVVLGGMLSKKEKDTIVWSKVKKSLKWETDKDGKQCLDILALSYEDLPYDLKPCFLYLGCFPEDSEIGAGKVIRLWTAEGFIPARQRETLEETAADYLVELVQRCMVQVVERNSYGCVKTFRVHDLLRDLCISEAKEDLFLDVYSTEDQTTSSASRRVALFHYCDDLLESLNSSSQFLRTLFLYGRCHPVKLRLQSLKLLRVIDLRGVRLRELPEEIKSVIHLRYLGLRRTKLSKIPPSIGDLCYLQTLDLGQNDFNSLPDAFWKIRSLRHVFFYYEFPIPIRRKIHAAKNLQTLKGVRGGLWIKKELPQMTNLQKLSIYEDSDSDETLTMLPNSLKNLSSLVSFTLEGNPIPTDIIPALSGHEHLHVLDLIGPLSKRQQLPNTNEFPQNLTKLMLSESALEVDPMATLEKLQNLRVLILLHGGYAGKEMVCSAGGFLQLQWLDISYLSELENWRVEEGAMPGLNKLVIYECEKLKMLPQGLRYVTTLKELELCNMPEAFRDRVRENDGEDWVAISHVPSINIR